MGIYCSKSMEGRLIVERHALIAAVHSASRRVSAYPCALFSVNRDARVDAPKKGPEFIALGDLDGRIWLCRQGAGVGRDPIGGCLVDYAELPSSPPRVAPINIYPAW